MGRVRTVQGGDVDRQIFSEGRKGPGGAYHQYAVGLTGKVPAIVAEITFADGKKLGCTNEDLLHIVVDRLECFQKGKFACRENEMARYHIQAAIAYLEERTADRKSRGVEGKHKK